LDAQVIEITSEVIKYKKSTNLDGPVYNIALTSVFMIRYANGTNDVITSLVQTNKNEPFYLIPEPLPSTLNIEKALKANEIYFYGYDYSEFKLSGPKRMTQNLKSHMFKFTGWMQEHMNEKKNGKMA
jgi:hypothetical protein